MKQTMTDLQVQVQKAILEDQRIKEFGIEALDDNGVITLRGTVPSREVKKIADTVVESVEGVVDVVDALDVEEINEGESIR